VVEKSGEKEMGRRGVNNYQEEEEKKEEEEGR